MVRSKVDPGWELHRRGKKPKVGQAFITETKIVLSEEAAGYIKAYKEKFPFAAYATEVEQWTERHDGKAKVVMKRYPSAD